MTAAEYLQSQFATWKVVDRTGQTYQDTHQAMAEAINAAWDNPAGRAVQIQLFPAGKPTVEEFISRMANLA